MPVIVNEVELTDSDVAAELPYHQGTSKPSVAAVTALIVRRVLLDEADRLQIAATDDETRVDALLAWQIDLPMPGEDECRRHYHQNPARFTVGELVEVDHILFQVTDKVSLASLRQRAETALAELLVSPDLFAQRAGELSNCPSGAIGGSLGQVGRGETVPEFERVVFAMVPGEILPRLVETRFGLHIVRLARHIHGSLLPFDEVRANIAVTLAAVNRDTAWRHYVQRLVGKAAISGIDLPGAATPLVQ